MKKLLVFTLMLVQFAVFAQKINIRGVDGELNPKMVLNHNGKMYNIPDDIFPSIDPEDIKSINVLKGKSALPIYGNQFEDGVVLISLKGNAALEFIKENEGDITILKALPEPRSSFEIKTEPKDELISIENASEPMQIKYPKGKDVHYILELNDKESKVIKKGLENLETDLIESLNVFKNQESLTKYKATGKAGVVIIRLKDTKEAKRVYKKLK